MVRDAQGLSDSRNTWYNVDVLGVLRGDYISPIFALKLGTRAIRKCLRDQVMRIKSEGLQNIGEYPCFVSEIGIPFDLNHGKAYVDGDYRSQRDALDASASAIEGADVGCTFWQYSIEVKLVKMTDVRILMNLGTFSMGKI